MLYSSNTSSFAQAGWLNWSQWGTNPFFFYECNGCNYVGGGSFNYQYPLEFGPVPNPNSRSDYDEFNTWEDFSGDVNMDITPSGDPNGVPYSFTLQLPWTVQGIEADGEVQNQVTETAGTTLVPEYFQNLQVLSGGSWQNVNLYSGSWVNWNSRNGDSYIVDSTYFEIWDTRY
jgi:hypothetical protein